MRSAVKIAIASLGLGFMLTSCSTLMNPYHSSFSCPNYYKGKCVSLEEAYNESIHNTDGAPHYSKKAQKQIQELAINTVQGGNGTQTLSLYQKDMLKKMTKLINQPKTPIVVPPRTMRVLILPYVNSQNELEMGRYVYFFVGKPKWIFLDK